MSLIWLIITEMKTLNLLVYFITVIRIEIFNVQLRISQRLLNVYPCGNFSIAKPSSSEYTGSRSRLPASVK